MSSVNKLKNLGNLKLNKTSCLYKTLKESSSIANNSVSLTEILDNLLSSIPSGQFDVLCKIVQLPASVALGLLSLGKVLKPAVNSWKDIQPLLLKFCAIDGGWSLKDARYINNNRTIGYLYWKCKTDKDKEIGSILRRRHRILTVTEYFHPDLGKRMQSWRLKDIDIWFLKNELLKLIIYRIQYRYWIGGCSWGRSWGDQFQEELNYRLNTVLPETKFPLVHRNMWAESNCSRITENIITYDDFNLDSSSRGECLLIFCALGRSRFLKWESFEDSGSHGIFSSHPNRLSPDCPISVTRMSYSIPHQRHANAPTAHARAKQVCYVCKFQVINITLYFLRNHVRK